MSASIGKMIFKITAIVSLLAFCYGEHIQNLQQRSNHAISSQMFHREDVPLSYNYTSIHVYTSPRPERDAGAQSYFQRPSYQGMQYAPLYPKKEMFANIGRQNKIKEVTDSPTSIQSTEKTDVKENLEPRNVASKNLDTPFSRSFVPGHNEPALQVISRSPGHNAVYRSYPKNSKRKQNKFNHLKQYMIYQAPETIDITTLSPQNDGVIPETQNTGLYAILTRQINSPETYLLHNRDLSIIEDTEAQQLHPKAHRIHLNVARSYALGQNIQKAPSFVSSPENSRIVPSHTQAIIALPETIRRQPYHHKTLLIPVADKKQYHVFHTSS